MRLGFEEEQAHFESESQRARSLTETWAASSLFCPACGNTRLDKFPNNAPVADLYCGQCREEFELKSSRSKFSAKVLDGAFKTMRARIEASNNPNFLFLRYNLEKRGVTDLFAVPKHFFVPSVLEERRPLPPTARRAGWIGCNILLRNIPAIGRIDLVRDQKAVPIEVVTAQWARTLFLREEPLSRRGWLVDILACVEELSRSTFTLDEIYAFEPRLRAIYPNNNNIRPKIRQQLQVLRDHGVLEFSGRGEYRLIK